jgi:hypothetical protein
MFNWPVRSRVSNTLTNDLGEASLACGIGAISSEPLGARELSAAMQRLSGPALMPPPRELLWLNYFAYYTADRFNNSNGD